jgi:heme/copper-type cytochrome/quinol oxidase subunit 2
MMMMMIIIIITITIIIIIIIIFISLQQLYKFVGYEPHFRITAMFKIGDLHTARQRTIQ